MSSTGEIAPSANKGKPTIWTMSAITATSSAARNRDFCELRDKSKDMESLVEDRFD
jgi:hypothetical protein